MGSTSPFQLLEINLISAQDIHKVSKSMKTYATTWVHPERKLTTRVDTHGGTHPTWNDKFVFKVDPTFLQSDTSAIMIEIHALHWFRDVHVGTVRVHVSNLIPSKNNIGMRFVALQVRRPSGRPQGILNIGVCVLDSTMRSMPLCNSSAVGYEKIMGDRINYDGTHNNNNASGPHLRRSRSDRSSFLDSKFDGIIINESVKNGFYDHNGSDLGSIVIPTKKKGEKIIYDKPLSIVDGVKPSDLGLAVKLKAQEGKADSILSYGRRKRPNKKEASIAGSQSDIGIKIMTESKSEVGMRLKLPPSRTNPIDYHLTKSEKQRQGYPIAKDFAAGSVWSESEVGPSPSEVAAAIAEDSKYRRGDDGRSSMLDDRWTIDESEGIRTKLDRWRTEMPPACDDVRSDLSSSIFGAPKQQRRRRTGNNGANSGKFTCFGNICGYQCTIVCGNPNQKNNKNIRSRGNNNNNNNNNKHNIVRPPPSVDSVSTYF